MSTRFQPFFGAKSLDAWIRTGGRPERKIGLYYPRLRWHAFFFEHNWRTQNQRIGAAPLPANPIFILGLWRSGTSVFHELLTAITGWNTPQTWQCFNPSTCFLSPPPSHDRSVGRPMDKGRISSFGPQEDEFAILLSGEPSIYRAFIDPRRLGECGAELWSTAGVVPPHALTRWRDFLRGLNSTGDSSATPWLFKSPSHTFRLPLIRELWPQAKFIWVGRDPYEIRASNVTMWREMVDAHGLWACPDAALDEFLDGMTKACAGVLARCLDDMPRENLLWVDFAHLHANPVRVVQRVLDFLGLAEGAPGSPTPGGIAHALATNPIHAGHRATVQPNLSAQNLSKLMLAARERFG